jgi:hypothetical protein
MPRRSNPSTPESEPILTEPGVINSEDIPEVEDTLEVENIPEIEVTNTQEIDILATSEPDQSGVIDFFSDVVPEMEPLPVEEKAELELTEESLEAHRNFDIGQFRAELNEYLAQDIPIKPALIATLAKYRYLSSLIVPIVDNNPRAFDLAQVPMLIIIENLTDMIKERLSFIIEQINQYFLFQRSVEQMQERVKEQDRINAIMTELRN